MGKIYLISLGSTHLGDKQVEMFLIRSFKSTSYFFKNTKWHAHFFHHASYTCAPFVANLLTWHFPICMCAAPFSDRSRYRYVYLGHYTRTRLTVGRPTNTPQSLATDAGTTTEWKEQAGNIRYTWDLRTVTHSFPQESHAQAIHYTILWVVFPFIFHTNKHKFKWCTH